jgi:N-acetylmuramic acid 6-phosphate (MurNAc-6-P) etherase
VKPAIVMHFRGVDFVAALALLKQHGESLRAAMADN